MPFLRKDSNLKEAEKAEELGEWEKAIKYYQTFIENEKKTKNRAKANLSIAGIYLRHLYDFNMAKNYSRNCGKHYKKETQQILRLASELNKVSDKRLNDFFFDLKADFLHWIIKNSAFPDEVRSGISILDISVLASSTTMRIIYRFELKYTKIKLSIDVVADTIELSVLCNSQIDTIDYLKLILGDLDPIDSRKLAVPLYGEETWTSSQQKYWQEIVKNSTEKLDGFFQEILDILKGKYDSPQKNIVEPSVLPLTMKEINFKEISLSPAFYCAVCEQKHLAGTPRMQCEACGRDICVEAFSEMAKAGRMICPMCDGKLSPT